VGVAERPRLLCSENMAHTAAAAAATGTTTGTGKNTVTTSGVGTWRRRKTTTTTTRRRRISSIALIVTGTAVILAARDAVAEPISSSTFPLPDLPRFNWSSFTQVENRFDPSFRGTVSLYWSIEQQGTREEALHGLIVLDTTKISNVYSTNPALVANSWVSIGLGACMLNSEFIMVHAMPNGVDVELEYLISSFDYAPPVECSTFF
jgi:hypothetical protein